MAVERPDPDTPVTIISRILSTCFASERFVSEGFVCACFALARRSERFVDTLRFIGWGRKPPNDYDAMAHRAGTVRRASLR
jgi:hypothetical protein